MLTRLKVSGFKNLVDVDVRFGPFTCIAGANGVGKSNLFDAIRFLSALADRPFVDAALSVRSEDGRSSDVRHIFHRVADKYDDEMSFEAEMIVPAEGRDDLGQLAKATVTFLRYSLKLAYRKDEFDGDVGQAFYQALGQIELISESLSPISPGEAFDNLLFDHSQVWRESAVSAVKGKHKSPFISTKGEGDDRMVKLHPDGHQRRTLSLSAWQLPRTALSSTNAIENPSALLARREMQSWRLLLLEPSSLRQPDEFTTPAKLGSDGAHLAATLYHLARFSGYNSINGTNGKAGKAESQNLTQQTDQAAQVYSQVSNRLADLIDDVSEVSVDRDEKRELLTLLVKGSDGTPHPARSLSDGTLRFLALAVLELDTEAKGVLCLEEPENGIHPERIPAMLKLLQDIATDVHEPLGPENPLRQVVINTHSPAVVMQVPDESILVAELKENVRGEQRFKSVRFGCLPETWRDKKSDGEASLVSKGKLLAYLNPLAPPAEGALPKMRRVVDRPDIQQLLPFFSQPPQSK